jgi:hypothetical protein
MAMVVEAGALEEVACEAVAECVDAACQGLDLEAARASAAEGSAAEEGEDEATEEADDDDDDDDDDDRCIKPHADEDDDAEFAAGAELWAEMERPSALAREEALCMRETEGSLRFEIAINDGGATPTYLATQTVRSSPHMLPPHPTASVCFSRDAAAFARCCTKTLAPSWHARADSRPCVPTVRRGARSCHLRSC